MTRKKNKKQQTRPWFFPTLGVSVEAETYEQALKLATSQQKEVEAGDVNP